jgi:hypothetical protein
MLRDVFDPVLEFRDQKWTFMKVEGAEVDFSGSNTVNCDPFSSLGPF